MSKEQNKNYGKSIRTKLLNVARKENVFHQTILTRYFQERLLYRISQMEGPRCPQHQVEYMRASLLSQSKREAKE